MDKILIDADTTQLVHAYQALITVHMEHEKLLLKTQVSEDFAQ